MWKDIYTYPCGFGNTTISSSCALGSLLLMHEMSVRHAGVTLGLTGMYKKSRRPNFALAHPPWQHPSVLPAALAL
jgi:hypothetical protein